MKDLRLMKTAPFIIAMALCLAGCTNDTSLISPSPDVSTPKADAEAETAPYSLTCFDAGKGDSFLITDGSFSILIDCGYKDDAEEILEFLYGKNIEKIDILIISHFDKDHVGGASKILKHMDVEQVICTNKTNSDKRTEKFFETAEKTGLNIEVPSSDINISGGSFQIMINPPLKTDYPDSDDNNSSLIVHISGDYGSMLFTGDAEDFRLREILDRKDLKCDVLKIPAHGRDFESLDMLLDITDPAIAIITSSEEDPPSDKILSVLDERNIKHLDPGDPDEITLIFDEKGIRPE